MPVSLVFHIFFELTKLSVICNISPVSHLDEAGPINSRHPLEDEMALALVH